jgi:uncharacterized phiE125 gp8 family phage protein
MIIYSVVNTQPDFEPVTLDEAKSHLEYYGSLKDSYIETLITAAIKICESYAGLSFVTQERSIKLDRFPWTNRGYINIPYGPIQAITSVVYEDGEGTEVEMVEGTDFDIDTQSAVARFYPLDSSGARGYWPTDVLNRANVVTINYQAGYDDVSGIPVPAQLKVAILMVVAKLFENRGDSGGREGILDWDVQGILDTVKVTWNAEVCSY